MNNKSRLAEAVHYFKMRPLIHVMEAARVKYEAYGKAGGTIMTEKLAYKELLALAEFMGMSEHALDLKRKFSISRFERRIMERWGITLGDLLEEYFRGAQDERG
ncbi:hypothetical protein [Halobacillus litoralis]|uniref:hypothetical protein n=1 Tax=Halobacillus litoralis TaxID=45668 RepID=UPI001CD404A4|nr:hypothetical protein [Halobacillus litoralis]MCA1022211.1 hypothetical protein [Halobacillus litoralis]